MMGKVANKLCHKLAPNHPEFREAKANKSC